MAGTIPQPPDITPDPEPVPFDPRALLAILDSLRTPEEFDAFLCEWFGETPESIAAQEAAFEALLEPVR